MQINYNKMHWQACFQALLDLLSTTKLATTHREYKKFDSLLEIHIEIFLSESIWCLGFPSKSLGPGGKDWLGRNVEDRLLH